MKDRNVQAVVRDFLPWCGVKAKLGIYIHTKKMAKAKMSCDKTFF
jgi:hypothetical protein